MSLAILLLFPQDQAELASEIRNELEDLPQVKEIEADTIIRKNADSARECLEERQYQFDLIIVHLHIPPEPQSPLDPSAQMGLAFLQELHKNKRPIPSILVAPAKNEALSLEVKKLGDTDLVLSGANLLDDLRLNVQKKLKTAYREPAAQPVHTVEEPKKKKEKIFGNVDIWLNLHSQPYSATHCPGQFDMHIYKPGEPKTFIGSGPLWLDWSTLYNLATKSRELENIDEYPWPRWKEELEALGGSLRMEICEKEENFQKHFKCLLKKVHNNIQNTRIRFKLSLAQKDDQDPRAQLSADLQAVVLEALLDDQRKFLMLQAPIFRRLDPSMVAEEEYEYKFPLFYRENGEKILKCLIIEADTCGYVSLEQKNCQVEKYLARLTHLRNESQELEKFLRHNHEVLRLSEDRLPEKVSFKEWVAQTLEQEGPWDLVHYAGHSLYISEDRTGYVFFPGDKTAEPMNIKDLSIFLRRAQARFVYLSSCQSSRDDFVFELANNLVPAILGFRWEIDDDKAKEYAVKFYQYLLQHRSLEQAFLQARRYVYKKYEDNRIWASPLLILQTP